MSGTRLGNLRAWIGAWMVCLLAVVLPFGLQRRLSRRLDPAAARAPGSGDGGRPVLRLWNRVILGIVFFLGFPLARLLAPLWARSRTAPRAGAPTYWVPRRTPEELEAEIGEPF